MVDNTITKDAILSLAVKAGKVVAADLVVQYAVSRQYVNRLINELVSSGRLVKIGQTKSSYYVLPEYAKKHPSILPRAYSRTYKNASLEEHIVLDELVRGYPPLARLPENVRSIFNYTFSEMFNNAIEHSQSPNIRLQVLVKGKELSFTVQDHGIGVFRNVMQQRKLKSEFEAMQDLLKGKTTTMPVSHSGQGIFFTSKSAELFTLDSYGYRLIVDNRLPDVFMQQVSGVKRGTAVTFSISTASRLHLNHIFDSYTNVDDESDYGFDKTEVKIKLYTLAGIYISRSQARRVLHGLDKFKVVVFDFANVTVIGQAFADEIFRVFHMRHPLIKLETANMNKSVKFMVKRAIADANNFNPD